MAEKQTDIIRLVDVPYPGTSKPVVTSYQPEIYWSILSERCGAANDQCYVNHLAVASQAGRNNFSLIAVGYTRTDIARNNLANSFFEATKRDNDLLVMLDGDHKYPHDIVAQFANEDPNLGVVGALAYRRGEPYDALWYVRTSDQRLAVRVEFDRDQVYTCAIVSTSAISIRRWVMVELNRKGYTWPWFRYEYPSDGNIPSEDMYFGHICERGGIAHHVDTRIEIPHAGVAWVNHDNHAAYVAAHPEAVSNDKSVKVEVS